MLSGERAHSTSHRAHCHLRLVCWALESVAPSRPSLLPSWQSDLFLRQWCAALYMPIAQALWLGICCNRLGGGCPLSGAPLVHCCRQGAHPKAGGRACGCPSPSSYPSRGSPHTAQERMWGTCCVLAVLRPIDMADGWPDRYGWWVAWQLCAAARAG